MKKLSKNKQTEAKTELDKHDFDEQGLLAQYDTEAVVPRLQNKYVAIFTAVLAVGYSLFHVYITYYPLPELLQRATHVGVGMALIFLLYSGRKSTKYQPSNWLDFVLVLLSFSSVGYLFIEYQNIVSVRGGIPNSWDLIFSALTLILVIEAGRRIMGWILPIMALIFLLYPFISHFSFMPRRLLTRHFDLGDILGQMYLKTDGIFSTAIGASVTFIFLFILFGSFLSKSGMGKLFNDLALALAGDKQGGPAKVAVISSGFMGSINGSAVGNVVGTGVFTIPLMKKIGYSKEFAGAVEASASVGGQILPPIMGASAFIMAETTGVSYLTIALAALFPALLYYLGVIAQVHFRAGKRNLQGIPREQLPQVKAVLKERGHLLLPIVALIVFLFNSVPIGFAATYTVALTIIISALRANTRMSIADIFEALQDGAKHSLSVVSACAIVGIVIGVVNLTSFGSIMTSSIMNLGGGVLFLTLCFTMMASLILGMGLPSIPAYIITATVVAPSLANFGIPILVAHMFVFYFGIFSNITPPVALASFAGAGIAGGNPMKTGWQSLRLSLAGFIVPFMFVYNPAMLMIDVTGVETTAKHFPFPSLSLIIPITITSIIGIIALSAAVEGYFRTVLNWGTRLILAASALLLIMPEWRTDIVGTVLIMVIFIWVSRRAKKNKQECMIQSE